MRFNADESLEFASVIEMGSYKAEKRRKKKNANKAVAPYCVSRFIKVWLLASISYEDTLHSKSLLFFPCVHTHNCFFIIPSATDTGIIKVALFIL